MFPELDLLPVNIYFIKNWKRNVRQTIVDQAVTISALYFLCPFYFCMVYVDTFPSLTSFFLTVFTALDLVEFTVKLLEDDPLFNAGK